MLRYDVSFVSQYTDLGHHEWRARGCGIAALKMVMDFYGSAPTLDELLEVGLAIGAHPDDRGWNHRGLVALARRYGHEGYNVDVAPQSPTPKTPDQAWEMLLAELEKGPVLASVWRYMDPDPHGGHMITVTGWDGNLLAFNDPIELTEREGRKLLAKEAFQKLFKQRYIVIRPAV